MKSISLLALTVSLVVISSPAVCQENTSERLQNLERRVAELEDQVPLLFLFGVFCALWAQNTGRNAWLWFFLGVFFNFIALLVLLAKNSSDRSQPAARGHPFKALLLLTLFGLGAFCILNGQNAGRDTLLWFSLGILLNLIAFWVLWATRTRAATIGSPFKSSSTSEGSEHAKTRRRIEPPLKRRDRLASEIAELETQWQRADPFERSLIENEIESRRRKLERSD